MASEHVSVSSGNNAAQAKPKCLAGVPQTPTIPYEPLSDKFWDSLFSLSPSQ